MSISSSTLGLSIDPSSVYLLASADNGSGSAQLILKVDDGDDHGAVKGASIGKEQLAVVALQSVLGALELWKLWGKKGLRFSAHPPTHTTQSVFCISPSPTLLVTLPLPLHRRCPKAQGARCSCPKLCVALRLAAVARARFLTWLHLPALGSCIGGHSTHHSDHPLLPASPRHGKERRTPTVPQKKYKTR